jgi:DNA-binding IclR family transcriptional regulator
MLENPEGSEVSEKLKKSIDSLSRETIDQNNYENSILRCAKILQCISNGAERIVDISCKSGLSVSTVHRILISLKKSTLVQQDPLSRHYFLGPLIYNLTSSQVVMHKLLILNSLNEMQRLMQITRETVTLSVPLGTDRMGTDRICLEEVESPEVLKYKAGKGSIAPLYSGAAGKVILAEMTDQQLQLIFQMMRFTPMQGKIKINWDALYEDVKRIKQCGYATSVGERIPDCASISVPIKNYVCPVALSILGPENRFGAVMIEFLDTLQKSAVKISKCLIQSI